MTLYNSERSESIDNCNHRKIIISQKIERS